MSAMGVRASVLATAAVMLAIGCTPPPARVTGRWVFIASAGSSNGSGGSIAVGEADAPQAHAPLSLVPGSPAAGTCLPPADMERWFGPGCAHEPELGAAPTPEGSQSAEGGGAMPGVRWYCQGHLVVRVRTEQCPDGRRVRVSQIAVATAPIAR